MDFIVYSTKYNFFLCKPVKKKLCVWIFFFLYNIKFFLSQTGFTDYGNLNLLYSINQYFHWMIIRVVVVDFLDIYISRLYAFSFHCFINIVHRAQLCYFYFRKWNGMCIQCIYRFSSIIAWPFTVGIILYLWNQHKGNAFESSNYLLLWRMCKGG